MVVICHSELFYISATLNSTAFACLYWCVRNCVFVVSRVGVLSASLCCLFLFPLLSSLALLRLATT